MKRLVIVLFIVLCSAVNAASQPVPSNNFDDTLRAQVNASSQQRDVIGDDDTNLLQQKALSNPIMEKKEKKFMTEYWGVLIALIFGLAQVATGYFSYRLTKNVNKNAILTEDLEKFAREILLLKMERESLISALKEEISQNPENDKDLYVDDTILNNLRESVLQESKLPKISVSMSDITKRLNLSAIPPIKSVDFRYYRKTKKKKNATIQ